MMGLKMAGRPSDYSEEIAARICEEIATTDHSIEVICQADDMPNARTVWRWLDRIPTFCQQYARAKEMQGDVLASQIIPISDDGSADTVTRYREDGSEYQAVDQEHINRSRLRVDARKWLASKLAPKKYGDRTALEHSGPAGGPVEHIVKFVRSNGDGRPGE